MGEEAALSRLLTAARRRVHSLVVTSCNAVAPQATRGPSSQQWRVGRHICIWRILQLHLLEVSAKVNSSSLSSHRLLSFVDLCTSASVAVYFTCTYASDSRSKDLEREETPKWLSSHQIEDYMSLSSISLFTEVAMTFESPPAAVEAAPGVSSSPSASDSEPSDEESEELLPADLGPGSGFFFALSLVSEPDGGRAACLLTCALGLPPALLFCPAALRKILLGVSVFGKMQ